MVTMARHLASWAWLLLLYASVPISKADPIDSLATAVLSDRTNGLTYFATSSTFGASLLPEKQVRKTDALPLVHTTALLRDPFGCTPLVQLQNLSASSSAPVSARTLPTHGSFILLVDRGHCFFGEKAWIAQQLGAAALLVTDTMEQAYNRTQANDATQDDRRLEFDCTRGSARVSGAVPMATFTNFSASGWSDLVNVRACNASSNCDSHMCIPSSSVAVSRQVCCMWDVPEAMTFSSSNASVQESDVTIPVVRIKIADGMALKAALGNNPDTPNKLLVTLAARATPHIDPSQFILWLLAILTVIIGGYKGAAVERERALRKLSAEMEMPMVGDSPSAADSRIVENDPIDEQDQVDVIAPPPRHPHVRPPSRNVHPPAPAFLAPPLSVASVSTLQEGGVLADVVDDETMEMTMGHAFAFVVFATIFLLVLFYWNVLIFVVVFFTLGAATCSYYVVWNPLLAQIPQFRHAPWKQRVFRGWLRHLEIETWTIGNVVSTVLSIAGAVSWFVLRHRKRAWIPQDLFGICLCILFLRMIRLPNLKIATVMLVLVFFYDIFMVFVSPLIFHESVMIKAATGGNQQKTPDGSGSPFCLRYPYDTAHHCVAEQMPLLLRFPRVLDWRDGYAMLGLGDIVLPGLLLVFCARYDYATRGQLYGRVKPNWAQLKFTIQEVDDGATDDHNTVEMPTHNDAQSVPRRGLFGMLTWAYAIGLLLANLGVWIMQQGQPALMYIVPTTLGTLVLVAWRRGILMKLWEGPEEFHFAIERQFRSTQRTLTQTTARVLAPSSSNDDVVLMNDMTPQSTSYARTDETPKHAMASSAVTMDMR